MHAVALNLATYHLGAQLTLTNVANAILCIVSTDKCHICNLGHSADRLFDCMYFKQR